MAAISSISNGEGMSSVRTKLNSVITEVNLLDPTDWVDYSATSTIVGWTGTFVVKQLRYRVVGKQVFVLVNLEATSNSTSTNFTLPFQSKNTQLSTMYAYDSLGPNWGLFGVVANSSTVTCYKASSASWSSSGTKSVTGQFFYEIA